MSQKKVEINQRNTGFTFMDQQKMSLLKDQVRSFKENRKMTLSDLVAKEASPLEGIPIRTACNASEHFGGMKMEGIRGQGDTICRTDNMPKVYNEILENQMTHIGDILRFAVENPEDIRIEYSSYAINRFLDLYDQPIPVNLNHALKELDIPDAKDDYTDGHGDTVFESTGRRAPVWAYGMDFSRFGWEKEYAMEKTFEYYDLEYEDGMKDYALEMERVYDWTNYTAE